MCGIAGIAAWQADRVKTNEIVRMLDSISHRGPDDWGKWVDDELGIGIGQRRLSILDLSPHGHQPMLSASGRWVISFNGEIYNYRALCNELEISGKAPTWRGHSDTEVLLACIEAWGIPKTLKKSVGMFAVAVWDRSNRILTLARDRMGEKPLYFGAIKGRIIFGSELKTFSAIHRESLEIDKFSVNEFLKFGYIPAPRSIWKGVKKILPGHWAEFRKVGDIENQQNPYWTPKAASENSELAGRIKYLGDSEIVDQLESHLTDSIKLQMQADVPLGAFLSGGIDSSAIVALMQKSSSTPINTFTIGFDRAEFNEAPYAKRVATHLGTNHSELYISGQDALNIIPDISEIYDEPFADSSQIPTILVCRSTSGKVKVALSGDGGDELFAGYPRYKIASSLWNKLKKMPIPIRNVLSNSLRYPTPSSWDKALLLLPTGARRTINGGRIHRLSRVLVSKNLGEMYGRLMTQWSSEENIVYGIPKIEKTDTDWINSESEIKSMRVYDLIKYLPDDLLVKVDRASMSVGLETRAPFLDHRLVEFALAMPEHSLIREGTTKWALRQVVYKYLPKDIMERPKAGFSVPLDEWLRGPLRDWAEDLISGINHDFYGILDPGPIYENWAQHLSGKFDRGTKMWTILMLLSWARDWNINKIKPV